MEMIYLKSFVAGIVAVVIFLACLPFIMTIVGFIIVALKSGEFGWDIVAMLKRPFAWIALFLAFSIGFIWKYLTLARSAG